MKIALIHDWLIQEGGAEKVLKAIYQIYPGDIYTLFLKNMRLLDQFSPERVYASWLNKLPKSHVYYRQLLPFFPLLMKSLNLAKYDVIISSSHCMAKNIVKQPYQTHICYCHTPARYLWDLNEVYQSQMTPLSSSMLRLFTPYLQREDRKGSENVDIFIANSHFVKDRIERYYQKAAKVIYPPVDVNFFTPSLSPKEKYYVTCSRLIAYKNIDLLVETFSLHPDKKLLIIGEGPERQKLESKAGRNISFLGWIPLLQLKALLQQATAFIYGAIEDFGIIMVEAIACGCPVIALGKGGAREIVMPDCGILFDEISTNSLSCAINQLEKEKKSFDSFIMHKRVKRFSYERFAKELREVVDSSVYSSRG